MNEWIPDIRLDYEFISDKNDEISTSIRAIAMNHFCWFKYSATSIQQTWRESENNSLNQVIGYYEARIQSLRWYMIRFNKVHKILFLTLSRYQSAFPVITNDVH